MPYILLNVMQIVDINILISLEIVYMYESNTKTCKWPATPVSKTLGRQKSFFFGKLIMQK